MCAGVASRIGESARGGDNHGAVAATVLIVDDHPSFRQSARLLLESDGWEVVGEAADGHSALTAARELTPDLVLLDVQLPDLDGFEVSRRLRANGHGARGGHDLEPRRVRLRHAGQRQRRSRVRAEIRAHGRRAGGARAMTSLHRALAGIGALAVVVGAAVVALIVSRLLRTALGFGHVRRTGWLRLRGRRAVRLVAPARPQGGRAHDADRIRLVRRHVHGVGQRRGVLAGGVLRQRVRGRADAPAAGLSRRRAAHPRRPDHRLAGLRDRHDRRTAAVHPGRPDPRLLGLSALRARRGPDRWGGVVRQPAAERGRRS